MKVARAGQQRGKESTAFEKLVPLAASSLRTCGMYLTSASAWSSVITTRMLGWLPVPAGRAPAGVAARRAKTAPARAANDAMAARAPTSGECNALCHTMSTALCWVGGHHDQARTGTPEP